MPTLADAPALTALTTWSGSASCTPSEVLRPASEADVVAIVRRAAAEGKRVKAVGAAHSFSPIAMTDGLLLRLDRLAGVVRVDKQRQVVTARAGTRLHAFNNALDAEGLALPIVGSIEAQSLAGLVATGTHGSSLRHGNLSACVVGMRMVTGTGEVLALEEGDPRLPAARLGLGALGIVTELTFRVDRAFRVAEETVPMTFDAAVDAFPEFVQAYEYAKFWWVPHTDRAQLFRGVRTDEPSTFSPGLRKFDTHVINGVVFPMLLALGNAVPACIPPLNQLIGAVYFQPKRTVGTSYQVLGLAMPPVHRETEFAIPLEHAAAALRRLRALITAKNLRINFILEARVVKSDDTWMSPAYGRETVQIGAYTTYLGDKQAWFDGADAIFADYAGRPHWGKELAMDGERLRSLYPRAGDFLALAKELDPAGVFWSPFLEQVFSGPG